MNLLVKAQTMHCALTAALRLPSSSFPGGFAAESEAASNLLDS
jgi:hypothetical protein